MSQESSWKMEVGPNGLGQLSPGLAALCLQDDLVQTIGVSAALGAAGVVLWGDLSISSSEVIIAPSSLPGSPCWGSQGRGETMSRPWSRCTDTSLHFPQEKCWHLYDYLVDTLGPYVINVTRAAIACSHQWCHGHGRCARRDPEQPEAFLHLQPDGSPGAWESFSCHCYLGWAGPTCQEPRPKPGPEETA